MAVTLFTVNGTGAPNPEDPGQYGVQVAEALVNPWQKEADDWDGIEYTPNWVWAPVAYPASIYPMGSSVDTGIATLVSMIANTPGKFAFAAWSQGALVTSSVWRDYMLDGPLANRVDDLVGSVTWGNPMRAPGVCNGNKYAGLPVQSGGGISGSNDLLPSQTPSLWLDFANPNDLYTDSPVAISSDGTKIVLNDTAKDEELIYNMVVTTSFGGTLEGLIALIESAVEQFFNPIEFVIGLAESIWNGLRFAAAGPAAGHYTYNISPAIAFLQQIGEQYA